jgi:gamma-tubulin complex component 3
MSDAFSQGHVSLIQRLIRHSVAHSGVDKAHPSIQAYEKQLLPYCVRLLGSRITSSSAVDVYHVCELCKKKLQQSDNVSAAVRFEELFRDVSRRPVLKNKWAVMHLLNSLSQVDRPADGSIAPPVQPMLSFDLNSMVTETGSKARALNIVSQPQHGGAENHPSAALGPGRCLGSASSGGGPTKRSTDYEQVKKNHLGQFDVPEQAILRDIVFAFQGIEGRVIKYDRRIDSFSIAPQVSVPAATRHLVRQLCEVGWLFRRVNSFVRESEGLDESARGLVGQSFAATVRRELADYYQLIAVLDSQLSGGGSDSEADAQDPSTPHLTLCRLKVWAHEPLQRLKLLAQLVDAVRGLKGGALASALHKYTAHGDPFQKA